MNNRKIKLLLVSSVFVDRGVERIITFLYQHLPSNMYDIEIACLRDLSPFADYLNRNTDIKVNVIGMKTNYDIPALMRFYKYIRTFRPDIINFHSFRAALWGRPLARFARVPVILYSVHNKWGGAVHRILDRIMARYTDAIVPFSHAVKKYLIEDEHIPERYIEDPIYIGIDVKKFSSASTEEITSLRSSLGLETYQNIIGFVGNLAEQKGLDYLIEAVKLLKPDFNDLCCIIIGDGPEERRLKDLVSAYRLKDNFRFLGQRYDIPDLLNVMKVFVLPSLWEGLPQVVIEAMAASCPVIATSVDGTPEIIEHKKNGWLISPGSIDELVYAIATLLTNEPLRQELTKNGFVTAKEKFNVMTMVNNYSRLYQKYRMRET